MKLRNKLILKGLFHSILQTVIVFFLAWCFDRIIEIAVMYICFFYFRVRYTKQYHALTSWGCTSITTVVYLICSILVPKQSSSILIVVCLSYFVNLLSYIYRDYLDLSKYRDSKLYVGMTESEFNNYCKVNKLTKTEIRRLKLRYVDKLNNKSIAELEYVEISTIEKFFSRYKYKMSS